MKKYLKNNKNGTKTVKEVYGLDNDNSAGVKANRMLRNDKINQAIVKEEENLKKALIKQGITAEKIAERVGVLLHAVDDKGKEDYNAIDKGLKHATNIFGVEDIQKDNKKIYNFFYQPEFQQNISNYDQFMKQKLREHYAKQTTTTEEDVDTE